MDRAAPSGIFCRPIPKARPIAPIKSSGLELVAKAPKATPTAKPSGKLWIVKAKKSKAVLDNFFKLFLKSPLPPKYPYSSASEVLSHRLDARKNHLLKNQSQPATATSYHKSLEHTQ